MLSVVASLKQFFDVFHHFLCRATLILFSSFSIVFVFTATTTVLISGGNRSKQETGGAQLCSNFASVFVRKHTGQ
jgi:hypothetical protein